jgi:hypothetical protein
MRNTDKKTPNKYDKCALCGEETEYAEMDYVNALNFHVNGLGQLCQACIDEKYHIEERKNAK